MDIKYSHTNIVAKDWRKLADFYQSVFGCSQIPPLRSQTGYWLEKGTGVKEASLEGVHLLLPGYGDNGPTLEIYSYTNILEKAEPVANRLGLGHIAFAVDDITSFLEKINKKGGKALGQIAETLVQGKGHLKFIYATDPEENIIELQCWS
jgi:predicted enzyme related to lactoylglutathione lyase